MKGMDLIGLKVEDKVSGQKGVVTSIAYDLYGCIQASITPKNSESKREEMFVDTWYDISRLRVLSKKPVMEAPTFEEEDFEEHGPAIKPMKF